VAIMNRAVVLKNLLIILGLIILIFTVFEYLVSVFSIVLNSALSYWIQVVYLLSILSFLILLVVFIEVRMRSDS
jgi:hypothetical protein